MTAKQSFGGRPTLSRGYFPLLRPRNPISGDLPIRKLIFNLSQIINKAAVVQVVSCLEAFNLTQESFQEFQVSDVQGVLFAVKTYVVIHL